MDEGVATFSDLFLDRSGWNLKLRFSLYNYNRSTGDWDETGVHFDTAFFHVGEGVPAALLLEQVEKNIQLPLSQRRWPFLYQRSVHGEVLGANGRLCREV